ncbi:MAG: FRG domain-containing protein [Syntrophaceae bacterium]|nr:FRG domain-containing protein [Syntrophaceae bacterium]
MIKKSSGYEEIKICKWEDFDEAVRELDFRTWVFRGHYDASFELKTSLYRMLEEVEDLIEKKKGKRQKLVKDRREEILLEKFQSTAHLYLKHSLPEINDKHTNRLEWNAIMQHYGTPTRLLDVTLSPYIAMYFALEKGSTDCCVFAFNHKILKEFDEEYFSGEDFAKEVFANRKGDRSFIIPFDPSLKTERILAQQGLFLVPSNNYETFNEILKHYNLKRIACKKIIIPSSLRLEGNIRLQRMNITTKSLFPGLEGFCRSLRYEVMHNIKLLEKIC